MASALFSERMWKEQPPSFSTQKPKCDIFFYTYLSRDGFYHLPWIHNLPQPVQTTLAAPRPSSLNACQASLENSRLLPSADLLSLSFFLLLLALFTPHKGVLWPTSTTEDFIPNGEWMDGWFKYSSTNLRRNPKVLRSFSWPASTEDFIANGEWLDGCMYVWIRGVNLFIHKSDGNPKGNRSLLGPPWLKI